ncbi:MAG: hypothetical protein DMG08_30340, partial [Acidobacteria bacterium]
MAILIETFEISNLRFEITTVRLDVVQFGEVTTALFAIIVVSLKEPRKIGLFSNELMPEIRRFSGGFFLS